MKYKLYKQPVDDFSAIQQILYNRGIDIDDQEKWLNASWNEINSYDNFPIDKLEEAAKILYNTINKNENIVIVVDCDVDGWSSAAIIINYLYKINPDYVANHISWIHHKGKEHGLKDVIDEISEKECSLVICPDSSSNDVEECQRLLDNNIQCIILDHHEVEPQNLNNPAIIINNQICDYPNKALTGAGVAWQFVRFYEMEFGEKNEDNFIFLIDLCALGNIGDMSDYRENEIRAIAKLGIEKLNNPFFKAMAKKNEYSIDKMNGLNYYSVAFYVVPFINSLCRSGTMEEKELVFDSFLEMKAYNKIPTTKRGHKGEEVNLVDEAVLVAERVKRRQTKLQDESMKLLEDRIQEQNLLNNSVIILLCNPGEVEKNVQGLCANKLQAKYQRPVLVLTYSKTKDDKEVFYRGSGRNYSLSEVDNLKDVLESTGEFEYIQGHQSAHGASIPERNITLAIDKLNEIYKDIDQTPVYWVDYVWNINNISAGKILEIGAANIYGQNIPESLICVENVCLRPNMITLMSPDKHPTLKIQLGNISIIKFKSSEEEYEEFCQDNRILTIVGKGKINEWNGTISPQIIVEDFELREDWIF